MRCVCHPTGAAIQAALNRLAYAVRKADALPNRAVGRLRALFPKVAAPQAGPKSTLGPTFPTPPPPVPVDEQDSTMYTRKYVNRGRKRAVVFVPAQKPDLEYFSKTPVKLRPIRLQRIAKIDWLGYDSRVRGTSLEAPAAKVFRLAHERTYEPYMRGMPKPVLKGEDLKIVKADRGMVHFLKHYGHTPEDFPNDLPMPELYRAPVHSSVLLTALAHFEARVESDWMPNESVLRERELLWQEHYRALSDLKTFYSPDCAWSGF